MELIKIVVVINTIARVTHQIGFICGIEEYFLSYLSLTF